MIKKETWVIVGCVVLVVVLAALFACELSNPEGGVAFIENLVGRFMG